MEQLLTTEEAMKYFNVKDSRTISKFRREGLKYFKIGSKDYRYRKEDLDEFTKHKIELSQYEIMENYPIKKKAKYKTMNIDFEKRRINLELNKVI